MLAVQSHSMGSSKPPDIDTPFGYNFPEPFPYPAPAPGPSLLDDRESQFLENFFEGVSSDLPFDYSYYTNVADGLDLGPGWDDLPPTFMGTQTSFGQPIPMQMHSAVPEMSYTQMNNGRHAQPPPPPPPLSGSTPSRVPGQTSFLDNTHNDRSRSNEAFFRGGEMAMPPTNGQARHSISHYTPTRAKPVAKEEPEFKDSFYADMVFGAPPGGFRPRQVSQNHAKVDVRWGSDDAFGLPEGFVTPASQRKEVAALEQLHIKAITGVFIEAPSSAENTQPSSPNVTRMNVPHQTSKPTARRDEEDDSSASRKRRKNSYKDEDDEGDDSPTSGAYKHSNKKRKPTKKSDSTMDLQEQSNKRRKSSAIAAVKATRENLTEDQKRENHIKSEQKRRTLIRDGFNDLNELVPGLNGGGFSKSAVLIMTADWLEELMQGNEVLKQRLAHMQGR